MRMVAAVAPVGAVVAVVTVVATVVIQVVTGPRRGADVTVGRTMAKVAIVGWRK